RWKESVEPDGGAKELTAAAPTNSYPGEIRFGRALFSKNAALSSTEPSSSVNPRCGLAKTGCVFRPYRPPTFVAYQIQRNTNFRSAERQQDGARWLVGSWYEV